MTASLSPLSPAHNANVMASRGPGIDGNWVTRLLHPQYRYAQRHSRHNLHHKTAAEMEARLLQRLFIPANTDDENLRQHLREAGAAIDP